MKMFTDIFLRALGAYFLLFFGLLSVSYGQTTRYAKADGTGDGSSWATAGTLTAMITASAAGDVVLVAGGTYPAFTMKTGVQVYGSFAGTETGPFTPDDPATPANEESPARARDGDGVFVNQSMMGSAKVRLPTDVTNLIVDGFTFMPAARSAITVTAGLNRTTLTISNCRFIGGSLQVIRQAGNNTFLMIRNCHFEGRDVQQNNLLEIAEGTVENCTFISNHNGSNASGAPAIFTNGSTARGKVVRIINCLFENNTAEVLSPDSQYTTNVTVTQTTFIIGCTFRGNSGSYGGAVVVSAGRASIINCLFDNNRGTRQYLRGGLDPNTDVGREFLPWRTSAILMRGGATDVVNCTFVRGNAVPVLGFQRNVSTTLNLRNSIVWGNNDVQIMTWGANNVVNMSNSIIRGGRAAVVGEGTIDYASTMVEGDPGFASLDPTADNYLHLAHADNSMAVNAGANSVIDAYLTDHPSSSFDLAGAARKQGPSVDIGVYERDPSIAAKQSQTITGFVLPTTAKVGQSVPSVATASSGLSVTYSSSTGVAAIGTGANAGRLLIRSPGETTITAIQAGDETYAAATPISIDITAVAPGTRPNPMSFFVLPETTFEVGDAPVDLMAIAGAASLFNTIGFATTDTDVIGIRCNKLTILGAGTAHVMAYSTGDDTFHSSAEEVAITVTGTGTPMLPTLPCVTTKEAQTIALLIAGSGFVGDELEVTAYVDSGLPLSFESTNPAVADVEERGGQYFLLLKNAGTVTITASQGGNSRYESAMATREVTINKYNLILAFSMPEEAFVGVNVPVIATIDSDPNQPPRPSASYLPINFSRNTDRDVARVRLLTGAGEGGNRRKSYELRPTAIGTATITARYFENTQTYNSPTSVEQTVRVIEPRVDPNTGKKIQTITFTPPSTARVGDGVLVLRTTNAALMVMYTSGNSDIIEVGTGADAGKLLMRSAGEATITATQGGNDEWEAAESVMRTITVTPAMVLGTTELEDNTLVLYPNPVDDIMYLSKLADVLHVYDMQGQRLFTRTTVREVEMSQLSSGRYVVEVVGAGQSVRYVVVKK